MRMTSNIRFTRIAGGECLLDPQQGERSKWWYKGKQQSSLVPPSVWRGSGIFQVPSGAFSILGRHTLSAKLIRWLGMLKTGKALDIESLSALSRFSICHQESIVDENDGLINAVFRSRCLGAVTSENVSHRIWSPFGPGTCDYHLKASATVHR